MVHKNTSTQNHACSQRQFTAGSVVTSALRDDQIQLLLDLTWYVFWNLLFCTNIRIYSYTNGRGAKRYLTQFWCVVHFVL